MSLGKDRTLKMSKVKQVRLRSEKTGEDCPEPAKKKQKHESDQPSSGFCDKIPASTLAATEERPSDLRTSSLPATVDQ